jgi:hypothetical protein
MPKTNIADIQRLRPNIEIGIKEIMEKHYGAALIQRVLSSEIRYTPLEPRGSGDVFQINLRIELHETPSEKSAQD